MEQVAMKNKVVIDFSQRADVLSPERDRTVRKHIRQKLSRTSPLKDNSLKRLNDRFRGI